MIVKEYIVDFKKPLKASYLQRFWFRKKRFFLLIIFSRPKKRVFLDFSCFFEIVTSRRNFFVYTKILCFQRFGFLKKRVFRLIFFSRLKKRVFFSFLVFLKLSHQDETFSFLPKYHIFNGLNLNKMVFSANNFF